MSKDYLDNKNFEKSIVKLQFYKKYKGRMELILEDLNESESRKKAKNKKYEESELLVLKKKEYKEVVKNYDKVKADLACEFYILSENLANFWGTFAEIDADDAIQEGVLTCYEKIDKFDTRKGKAFNYMTTCIINHFRQLYRSARNFNELKKRFGAHLHHKYNSSKFGRFFSKKKESNIYGQHFSDDDN